MTASSHIRAEESADYASIFAVVAAAFPSSAEARLVDSLRSAGRLAVSLVATFDDTVVGHIAFSPVTIETPSGASVGLGLAPVSVAPQLQRQGIGSLLVRAGIERCRQRSVGYIVVLGDPNYYRRFGFVAANRWGIANEYGASQSFMALELFDAGIPQPAGVARYAEQFALVA